MSNESFLPELPLEVPYSELHIVQPIVNVIGRPRISLVQLREETYVLKEVDLTPSNTQIDVFLNETGALVYLGKHMKDLEEFSRKFFYGLPYAQIPTIIAMTIGNSRSKGFLMRNMGNSLYQLSTQTQLPDYQAVKSTFAATAITLSWLHSKNIIHGDFKLEQILTNKDTSAICDFGGARKINNDNLLEWFTRTSPFSDIGSNCYVPLIASTESMAPEAILLMKQHCSHYYVNWDAAYNQIMSSLLDDNGIGSVIGFTGRRDHIASETGKIDPYSIEVFAFAYSYLTFMLSMLNGFRTTLELRPKEIEILKLSLLEQPSKRPTMFEVAKVLNSKQEFFT